MQASSPRLDVAPGPTAPRQSRGPRQSQGPRAGLAVAFLGGLSLAAAAPQEPESDPVEPPAPAVQEPAGEAAPEEAIPEEPAAEELVEEDAPLPLPTVPDAPRSSARAVAGRLGAGGRGRADYTIRARLDRLTEADVEAQGAEVPSGGPPFTLDATLTLTYTHGSSHAGAEPVSDLWFHVYLNAFANDASTHLTESDGRARGRRVDEGWGFTEVEAVRLAGAGAATDLTPSLEWEHPEGLHPEDRTVFSVDLPAPLADGEQVVVEVEWRSQLPRVRRRTGYKDDFLLVAQWFPKLGVWEDERGWNCHEFHASTEFYSNFGTYDVTLDLPGEYRDKVLGSGQQFNSVPVGDRVEVTFLAPSYKDREGPDAFGKEALVHDFAWTADPDYVVERGAFVWDEWAERFPEEVARAQAAFGPDVDLRCRDVAVTALIQPEHAPQAERHVEATCAALFFYGLWFGEYPYEHVTVIDPAWGGGGAGGMEYPTLFTSGTRMFNEPWMQSPEGVTVHEAGHQFFYGLVANNEFEAAWLDEGFNSYADAETLWRVYGTRRAYTSYAGLPMEGVRLARVGAGTLGDVLTARRIPLGWTMLTDGSLRPLRSSGFLDWWRDQPLLTTAPREDDPRWGDRGGYLRSPDRDPLDTWGWEAVDSRSHSTNSYPRTAVVLRSLGAAIEAEAASRGEAVDGDAAFLRGMRGYATDWRYRHPYADDFFASFAEHDGLDLELDWAFEQLFRGTGTVDWSLTVSQARDSEPQGFFPGPDGRYALRDGEPEPATAEPEGDGEGDGDGDDEESGADVAPEPERRSRPWRSEVVLRRRGDLVLPVTVRLEWEDGAVETLVWSRAAQEASRWLRVEREHDARLASAVIDPEGGTYLDVDRSNNGWFADSDEASAWRWSERLLAQLLSELQWRMGVGG